MNTAVRSEDPAAYLLTLQDDDSVIARALAILTERTRRPVLLQSPQDVKDYLCVRAAGLGHEEFTILFLDSQHRLIEARTMFRGTLSQCSVYPREVVRAAVELNAGAVILSHNHPSGSPEPSRADEMLTATLKSALALVDVRTLDHIVVGGGRSVSLAERGLI